MNPWVVPWLLWASYQDLETRSIDLYTVAAIWTLALATGHPNAVGFLTALAVFVPMMWAGGVGDGDVYTILALTWLEGWTATQVGYFAILSAVFGSIVYAIRRRKEIAGVSWIFHSKIPLLPGITLAYLSMWPFT